MYGWRARCGLIVPANNTVAEPELTGYLPPGVSLHTTRVLGVGDDLFGEVHSMTSQILTALAALRPARIDAALYGCMISCIVKGPEWEAELSSSISDDQELPFGTAGLAMRRELARLDVKRVSISSPYPDSVRELVSDYFVRSGIEVKSNDRLVGVGGAGDFGGEDPRRLFRQWAQLPRADALCILATDIPTLDVIKDLEHVRQGPVVSSNLAIRDWFMSSADPGCQLGTTLGE